MPADRLLAACLALLALTGCAVPTSDDTVMVPAQPVPGARMPPGPLPASFIVPTGAGPFPAVILLHTCSGRSPLQRDWAARLNGWGYAVLIPNSFAPRGVVSVCAPVNQPLVTAADRAGDVISAALWLQKQPRIDASRIGVLGNSHGGGTAAWVTQIRYEQLYPGLLKASVDYYGPCRSPDTHGTVPLLALAGDDDDWGQPALTCRAMASKLKPDQPFEIHTYPGVVHAFDNARLRGRVSSEGHALEYDPAAAEDSFVHVQAFFARYLAGHRAPAQDSSDRAMPTISPKSLATAAAPAAMAGGP